MQRFFSLSLKSLVFFSGIFFVSTGLAKGVCPGEFKLALDIGHYENKPGSADIFGVPELTYNRNLAAVIKDSLVAGKIDVITIESIPRLSERPLKAACSGADLFLSVHHDSVPDDMKVSMESDGKTFKGNSEIFGYTIYLSSDNRLFPQSLDFARLLSLSLASNGVFSAAPHQSYISDSLRQLLSREHNIYDYKKLTVSKTARLPAVLMEAGFLSNPNELRYLKSKAYQEKIGKGVLQAVEAYCREFPWLLNHNEVFQLTKEAGCR